MEPRSVGDEEQGEKYGITLGKTKSQPNLIAFNPINQTEENGKTSLGSAWQSKSTSNLQAL